MLLHHGVVSVEQAMRLYHFMRLLGNVRTTEYRRGRDIVYTQYITVPTTEPPITLLLERRGPWRVSKLESADLQTHQAQALALCVRTLLWPDLFTRVPQCLVPVPARHAIPSTGRAALRAPGAVATIVFRMAADEPWYISLDGLEPGASWAEVIEDPYFEVPDGAFTYGTVYFAEVVQTRIHRLLTEPEPSCDKAYSHVDFADQRAFYHRALYRLIYYKTQAFAVGHQHVALVATLGPFDGAKLVMFDWRDRSAEPLRNVPGPLIDAWLFE